MVATEPKLTYAVNPEGRLVSINDVPRGRECNCSCPKCKQPLIAKKGEHNQHHFAHDDSNQNKCEGSYESALHYLSKQIIREKKNVWSPKYEAEYVKRESESMNFKEVEEETRNDFPDLQPDLVGITQKGNRIYIEIKNTHKVDEKKEKKVKSRDIYCMEIDVSKKKLEELEDFLLKTDEDRKWICNPWLEKENSKEAERLRKEQEERDKIDAEALERKHEKMARLRREDEEEERIKREIEANRMKKEQAYKFSKEENTENLPLLERLRKEKKLIDEASGKCYEICMCDMADSGNSIVARVFDCDYTDPDCRPKVIRIYEIQGRIYTEFYRYDDKFNINSEIYKAAKKIY